MSTATIGEAASTHTGLGDEEIRKLVSTKVFFGHKSVGENVIVGIKGLMANDPRLKLNLVRSSEPASVRGPAFIETEIGENTDPVSKNDAFYSDLRAGLGATGGIAMYKYCYVDITGSTNVPQLFDQYRRGIESLTAAHRDVQFVHVTVPLTTVEPAAKAWLKEILGRPTSRAANAKRNEFNQLLRQSYAPGSIFDLATVESTRPDGSRSYFTLRDKPIYTLAEEYTTDGGHLNAIGSEVAARELLKILAKAADRD